jgi:hypothetical protein
LLLPDLAIAARFWPFITNPGGACLKNTAIVVSYLFSKLPEKCLLRRFARFDSALRKLPSAWLVGALTEEHAAIGIAKNCDNASTI